MKIEIWSDFICPYCYIGKRKLEIALEKFPHDKNVFIKYKSFELDPNAEKYSESNMYELLSKQYDVTIEEARISAADISKQAVEFGLVYNFDAIKPINTFDAHRLVQYAARQDKGSEMAERLLKAYFTEFKHIGEQDTLLELACEIGLDTAQVKDILQSCKFTKDVRFDEEEAKEIGVTNVPFFVINEKYAISGIQSPDVFLQVLEQVWEEEYAQTAVNIHELHRQKDGSTYCCEGESCTKDEVRVK